MRLTASAAVSSIEAILSLYPSLTRESVKECRLEFLRDVKFFSELDQKMVENRKRRTKWREWYEFFYMVVRFSKPQIVIETGVFDGQSTAVILLALDHNNSGELISIDLPAYKTIEDSTHKMKETSLPANCLPGWLVPDSLKKRWRLVLGDSKKLLPELLSREYPKIDIFFHDSLHTFEYQYFEYATAWPHLSEGGILLSDDIFWSPAFHKICKEKHRTYVRLGSGFGAVIK